MCTLFFKAYSAIFKTIEADSVFNCGITIGAIGYGTNDGEQCVWIRGGRKYSFLCNKYPICCDCVENLKLLDVGKIETLEKANIFLSMK